MNTEEAAQLERDCAPSLEFLSFDEIPSEIMEILPSNYEFKVSKYNLIIEKNFTATVRIKADTAEALLSWLNDFEILKKNNRDVANRDEYVKKGYFGEIILKFTHNHDLSSFYSLKHLPPTQETKQIFMEYFRWGKTPAAAKRLFLEQHFNNLNDDSLDNSREIPQYKTISGWYRSYKKSNSEFYIEP
ncbi:hypothetical protein T11_13680 [Trichinella zimbabwensis]|uniref:Uncharacterized protein n=1 Tax=Trichinella zimbabwensis TaxID=268475 RepID=A0A0V1GXJ0_9BILA|nr:hypothetical protein T11_13680 [Trichinella zimbabwensis]